MAVELGAGAVAISSPGNAAGALAAYAAAAGLEAHVFLPAAAPQANFIECKAFGARVTLVDGPPGDCEAIAAGRAIREGWLDVSTLKEPYRVEGQKTVGYELAEQLRWRLPDAVLHPTGAGAGLIGLWKAFAELEELGWVAGGRPKLIAVQMEGCQPVVRAWERGEECCQRWENAWTVAGGLRVPEPLGGDLILRAIRESDGMAVAVSDQAALDAGIELAAEEGLFPGPEGGACVAALRQLLAAGRLNPSARIVIFNPGSGLKHLEAYSTRFPRQAETEQDKLGGLITPR
jgi:threonine synthase